MVIVLLATLGIIIGYLVAEAVFEGIKQVKVNQLRREIGLQPKKVAIYGIIKETPRKVGM